jgi:probable F420-dependent oxidoreductase
MAANGKRKYWGIVVPLMPAEMIAGAAKQMEDAGIHGVYAIQVYGPPWIPLAAAATTTSRVQLLTGIAQAFVRSPFETAMAAIDLDRISNGRFILGLGSTVRAWSQGIYGMPGYGKPVEHLRETVEVIRHIVANAHTGNLGTFHGRYHDFDWSEFYGALPPLRTEIPIWLAPVRGPMIELSGEIADGYCSHPIWSHHWAVNVAQDHLRKGLARAGRKRSDFHQCIWQWCTPNEDPRESIEDARGCVAFYAGVQQYQSYYAAHGFEKEALQIQEGARHGDYMSGTRYVTDEMAQTFVVTGTPDEVRRKIEPLWEVADSMALIPPALSLPPEKSAQYFNTIAEVFYAEGAPASV